MSKQTYTQCVLVKTIDGRQHIKTAFIPSQFARTDKILAIDIDDKRIEGWIVKEVGQTVSVEEITIRQRLFTSQRQASDI